MRRGVPLLRVGWLAGLLNSSWRRISWLPADQDLADDATVRRAERVVVNDVSVGVRYDALDGRLEAAERILDALGASGRDLRDVVRVDVLCPRWLLIGHLRARQLDVPTVGHSVDREGHRVVAVDATGEDGVLRGVGERHGLLVAAVDPDRRVEADRVTVDVVGVVPTRADLEAGPQRGVEQRR